MVGVTQRLDKRMGAELNELAPPDKNLSYPCDQSGRGLGKSNFWISYLISSPAVI